MIHASGQGLPKVPPVLLTNVAGVPFDRFYSLKIIFQYSILIMYNDSMKVPSKQKHSIYDWLTHDDFKILLRENTLEIKKA